MSLNNRGLRTKRMALPPAQPAVPAVAKRTLTDAQCTVLAALGRFANSYSYLSDREARRGDFAAILTAMGLPAEHVVWLTGTRPFIFAPPELIAWMKEHNEAGLRRSQLQDLSGVPRSRPVELEWRGSGDGGITFPEYAAQELGITLGSFMVRLSTGGGKFSLTREVPGFDHDDIVVVNRVSGPISQADREAINRRGLRRLEELRVLLAAQRKRRY